jgi:chemotaxis protein CheX
LKAVYINPFIMAAINLFKDYLGMQVKEGKPFLNPDPQSLKEISGIIGLAGDTKGAIVLSLDRETALKVSGKFAKKEFTAITNDVIDCVGEIVNIIAGNAKKDLLDFRISISLPGVITGKSYKVSWPTGIPVITIPFESEYGNFTLNVSLKDQK